MISNQNTRILFLCKKFLGNVVGDPVIGLYNQGIITAVHICHVFMSGEICHSG